MTLPTATRKEYMNYGATGKLIEVLEERIKELQMICAEAYQVVGTLSYEAGRFDEEKTIKLLDNLSQHKMIHEDVLPYPSKVH